MEVILLEKVRNLGSLGEQVNVKNGYGRNFLLPSGKAVRATASNIEKFEARRAELEKAAAETLAVAEQRAAELGELKLLITSRASDEGKLFGSIGVHEISEAIEAQGIKLEKREIQLPEGPMRTIGEAQVEVTLHSDVTAVINVVIEAE